MPGTRAGGLKARDQNLDRYGAGYYQGIGGKGGTKSRGGGFGGKGADPHTAGRAGGLRSGQIRHQKKLEREAAKQREIYETKQRFAAGKYHRAG